MLNDLKALDNIKKKVKSEVDKGTKWMAEHGDKVSGVLDRVSNVAKRTSLVAGVVGKVATVASVVPGLNVVAAPIAAASFTVANAADKVKDVARLGRDVTMVATSLSKGYQDGGVKGAMKEGTKMVGNRLVNRAITKASEEITGAISNKAAGVLGKGITKLATKNVKLSGMVGKVSNVLKESELAEKVKEKVKKKLKGKVSKTLKKGVNKVAKGKVAKSIKKKAVKAIKNKIPFIAKNIKSVAAKIKGSKSGTITAKKLQELKFNKGKVKSIASKFKRNGSGKTKIQQKSKPLGKIGKLKQKINTKTKLLSHKTTKKINSIKNNKLKMAAKGLSKGFGAAKDVAKTSGKSFKESMSPKTVLKKAGKSLRLGKMYHSGKNQLKTDLRSVGIKMTGKGLVNKKSTLKSVGLIGSKMAVNEAARRAGLAVSNKSKKILKGTILKKYNKKTKVKLPEFAEVK